MPSQVLGGPFKPTDEIAFRILRGSNLSVRDGNGRTILFEAISQNSSEVMMNFLLTQGMRIGLRDKHGLTAYDFAKKEKKDNYCKMLDNHVISLVRDCDMSRIEDLNLLGYDRLMKAKDKDGVSALGIARGSDSTQLKNTLDKFYDVQVRFDKMKIYSIFNTKLSVQLHKHSYLSILIYCTYITTCTRRLVCRI